VQNLDDNSGDTLLREPLMENLTFDGRDTLLR
jgi:hypothetical protein